jgi:conjugal transfer pilus assembly protein TraD
MSAKTVFSFNDPFRRPYEYIAMAGWAAAAGFAIYASRTGMYPRQLCILLLIVCVAAVLLRFRSAQQVLSVHRDLRGHDVMMMPRRQLRSLCELRRRSHETPALFLGYGYDWTHEHTQMVHLIRRAHPSRLRTPDDEDMGQPWIHGIGIRKEEEVWLPLDHTTGHILLVGTTRAGKTRLLDLIVAQAVDRGEAVVVWDPKGDHGLRECAQKACEAAGRPRDFIFFSPAFPEKSARIDPLANFTRATELATRIASLIPSETGADPFAAFSQKILSNLCEGLMLIHKAPSLIQLKRFVDSGPDKLLQDACEAYFAHVMPKWREGAGREYLDAVRRPTPEELCNAYIHFYRSVIATIEPHTGLEGLMADFEHDRSHQAKMTASLSPVLTMLTAGNLGELLSPTPNPDDPRPITNFARIVANRQVCYIGLDALSDNMVGSSIGSMFVADMTAVSGARYNFGGDPRTLPPVNLIVDEAAELASDKLIQLLNKSGGANFRMVIATQTFADFSARLGSSEKARQVLGNLNNVIVLRLKDAETMEYVSESLPEVSVRHIEYSQATGTHTTDMGNFAYRLNEAMKETATPLVQPELLGCLPNLQGFANISGGRVKKIRTPVLED